VRGWTDYLDASCCKSIVAIKPRLDKHGLNPPTRSIPIEVIILHGGGWWGFIRSDEDARPTISAQLLRRVWAYARPYRLWIFFVLAGIFVSTLLDTALPLVVRDLINHAIPDRDFGRLNLLALARPFRSDRPGHRRRPALPGLPLDRPPPDHASALSELHDRPTIQLDSESLQAVVPEG